jgi:hypothetical protein
LYLDILVWSPQKEASQKPPSRKFTTQEDSGQKDCPGKIEKTLHINGLFATNNELLIRSLDEIGREFSVGLKDKVGESRLISLASLAGGYLSMACSFSRKDIHEQVRTYLDDSAIDNEFSDYKVYLHFRYLLVCRFSELAEQILAAIRQADPDTMDRSTCWNRYAAAVILHCEVHHFKDSLKNGLLSKSVRLPASFVRNSH